ncbi:MAG: hypothetical protein ACK4MD_07785, partial [Demequina sp.]
MRVGKASKLGAVVTLSTVMVASQAVSVGAQTTSSSRSSSTSTSSVALPEGQECPLVQLVAVNGTTESS